jgi:hypothetical protein
MVHRRQWRSVGWFENSRWILKLRGWKLVGGGRGVETGVKTAYKRTFKPMGVLLRNLWRIIK